MRYMDIPMVEFTNINGEKFNLKDLREIPQYDTMATLKIDDDTVIDEIITRSEFYGEGSENLSYLIADKNAEKLLEEKFIMSSLKQIKIPVLK